MAFFWTSLFLIDFAIILLVIAYRWIFQYFFCCVLRSIVLKYYFKRSFRMYGWSPLILDIHCSCPVNIDKFQHFWQLIIECRKFEHFLHDGWVLTGYCAKENFLKIIFWRYQWSPLSYAWQLVNKCWKISTFLCMMGGLLTYYCASNFFLMKHFLKVQLNLFYLSDKSWLVIECWKISTIQCKIGGALMGYCANKFFLKGIFWKYSWYSFIWAINGGWSLRIEKFQHFLKKLKNSYKVVFQQKISDVTIQTVPNNLYTSMLNVEYLVWSVIVEDLQHFFNFAGPYLTGVPQRDHKN